MTALNFKVWAYIEREDADGDTEDVGEPVPIGEFESYEEANHFLIDLSIDGEGAGPADETDPGAPAR